MLPEIWLLSHLALYQPQNYNFSEASSTMVLAGHSISMDERYNTTSVNKVFKDNILLSVHYLANDPTVKGAPDWREIEKPYNYEFSLSPGEEFAFHGHTLPQYSKNVVKTMNSSFYWNEGYKSDGYLVGDGVCHIASLIYWAAKDAGLTAFAPSNHNFAKINGIPKEYGVAIKAPNPMGNLYIVNNKDTTVRFVFDFDGENLEVKIIKT